MIWESYNPIPKSTEDDQILGCGNKLTKDLSD